jgi:predicted nucleic acid-binding protein
MLLDNEAVRALGNPGHPKHRRLVTHAQVVARRKARTLTISIAIPTAVRVEAGWDRTDSAWAFVNQLRVEDIPLGTKHADTAAAIGKRNRVSVADAHLGAAIQGAESDHVTVITSDPRDMRAVAEGRHIDVVAI